MSVHAATAGQARRFAAYRALRDTGTNCYDAARQIGVAPGTGQVYERAYREARGLPRRRPGAGMRGP